MATFSELSNFDKAPFARTILAIGSHEGMSVDIVGNYLISLYVNGEIANSLYSGWVGYGAPTMETEANWQAYYDSVVNYFTVNA